MIRIRICGVTLRLHVLALLMAALAFALGVRIFVLAVTIALALHELSHFVAARLLHVRVEVLDLMPFGGAFTMENPYLMSKWQLFGVSMAGPISNILGLFISSALAWWNVISPDFAFELIRANLMLAVFNLIPALPLDGGRALYALLQSKIGRGRALSILVYAGYALAIVLLASSVAGFIGSGKLNLALPLAAIFLIASGSKERAGANRGEAEALAERMYFEHKDFKRPEALRVLAVNEQAEALSVLRALSPREEALLAVYRQGKLSSLMDSREIERAFLDNRASGEPLKIEHITKNRHLEQVREM